MWLIPFCLLLSIYFHIMRMLYHVHPHIATRWGLRLGNLGWQAPSSCRLFPCSLSCSLISREQRLTLFSCSPELPFSLYGICCSWTAFTRAMWDWKTILIFMLTSTVKPSVLCFWFCSLVSQKSIGINCMEVSEAFRSLLTNLHGTK